MIIEIQPAPIPVSYLSSLLRIIQVALRETAFSSSHIDPSASHQPILLASLSEKNNKLSIEFSFADSKTNAYLEMLSESIFEEFFQNFGVGFSNRDMSRFVPICPEKITIDNNSNAPLVPQNFIQYRLWCLQTGNYTDASVVCTWKLILIPDQWFR